MINFKDKKVFFSGYGEKVQKDELIKYCIQNQAQIVDDHTIADMIIQGFKTPVYLEDQFYLLSKEGKQLVTIEQIEKQFSVTVDIDSIILAVKISKDKSRVVKLLNNRYFLDDVFLKLLKFYDWEGAGLYDNDNNRDVATAVVARFSKLQEFNHNIQHSPIGVYYTALETQNPKLLEAMYNMPNFSINAKNAKKDQPLSLKEVVALNPNTPKPVLMEVLKNNNLDELKFLALNSAINKTIAQKLCNTNDKNILKNLLLSNNIEKELFEKTFDTLFTEEKICNDILKNIELNSENFEILLSKNLENVKLVYLSSNKTLTPVQIEKLFEKKIENVNINLLKNANCPLKYIKHFLQKDDLVYDIAIAHNNSLEQKDYEVLFYKNDLNIDISLAANNGTSQKILKQLFEKNIYEINFNLSQNTNTPIGILLQLQVDTSFQSNVSNNETYKEFSRNNLGIIKEHNNRFKRDTYGNFWDEGR